ncbi:MAG: hypothetical protein WCQ44_12175, partial [Opitutaceae bacterium]
MPSPPRVTPCALHLARILVPLLACLLVNSPAQVPTDNTPLRLADFVVAPSRFGVGEHVGSVAATLTQSELATLPQIGEDVYRTLVRLPGVAADDFTAKFWVRGAANGKLLARL